MTSSKKRKTYTHHDIINQRPQTKNKKNLYQFQTTRLSESLDGLNSSRPQSAGESWLLAKMTKVTFVGFEVISNFWIFGATISAPDS